MLCNFVYQQAGGFICDRCGWQADAPLQQDLALQECVVINTTEVKAQSVKKKKKPCNCGKKANGPTPASEAKRMKDYLFPPSAEPKPPVSKPMPPTKRKPFFI